MKANFGFCFFGVFLGLPCIFSGVLQSSLNHFFLGLYGFLEIFWDFVRIMAFFWILFFLQMSLSLKLDCICLFPYFFFVLVSYTPDICYWPSSYWEDWCFSFNRPTLPRWSFFWMCKGNCPSTFFEGFVCSWLVSVLIRVPLQVVLLSFGVLTPSTTIFWAFESDSQYRPLSAW